LLGGRLSNWSTIEVIAAITYGQKEQQSRPITALGRTLQCE